MRATLFSVAVLATSSVTASRLFRLRVRDITRNLTEHIFTYTQQVPDLGALPVPAPIPAGVVPRDLLPGGKTPLDSELVQYKTFHSRATEDRVSFVTPEGEHPIIDNFHAREHTEVEADNDKSDNDASSIADWETEVKEPCAELEGRAPLPAEEQALAAKTNGLGLATHHFDNTGASKLTGDLQPRGAKAAPKDRHSLHPTAKHMARNDIPMHLGLDMRPTGFPQPSANGEKIVRSTVAKMVKVGSDDTGLHYQNYKENI